MSLRATLPPIRRSVLMLSSVVLAILAAGLVAGAQGQTFQPLPDLPRYRIQVQGPAGSFRAARGIELAPDGSLYVLDAGHRRVQRFDLEGQVLDVWGRAGLGDGELREPVALTVRSGGDAAGEVLVLEADGRVLRFDEAGAYAGAWLAAGPAGEAAGTRSDIALGPDDGAYVLESGRLLAFDAEGRLLWRATPAAPPTDFQAVTMLSDGRLAIADGGQQQIHILSSTGRLEASWSSAGRPKGQPARILDLQQAADGSLLTAHERGGDVQRFDPDGTWLETIEVEGIAGQLGLVLLGDGRMALLDQDQRVLLAGVEGGAPLAAWGSPSALAPGTPSQIRFAPDGSLLLAESEPARILRLDADGRYLGEIDAGETPFGRPMHMAFTPEGELLVTDRGANTVRRFTAAGEPDGQLLDDAGDPVSVRDPRGIAVDASGTVAVADRGKFGRVQIFSADGAELRTWNKAGPAGPTLYGTQGLAMGARGGIFLLDHHESGYSTRAAAYRFDREAEVEARFGPYGDGPGHFRQPTDLRALGDGTILVADTGGGRLQRFDGFGGFLQSVALAPGARPISADLSPDGRLLVADADGGIEVLGPQPDSAWRVEHYDSPWLTGWPTSITHTLGADWSLDLDPGDPILPPPGASARFLLNTWLPDTRYTISMWPEGDVGLRLRIGGRIVFDGLSSRAISHTLALEIPGGYQALELELRRGDAASGLALSILPDAVPRPTAAPTRTAFPTDAPTRLPSPTATELPALPAPIHLPFTSRGPVGAGAMIQAGKGFLPNLEIDVEDYDIELRAPDLAANIEARAIITLTALADLSAIDLDLEPADVRVHAVRARGRPVGFSWIGGREANRSTSGQSLRVLLAAPVGAGQPLSLVVDYTILAGRAFSYDDWRYGGRILSNVGWPYRARRWLPSNDHPADPARARFTLRVPADTVAAANGALEGGDYRVGSGLDADGLRVFRWNLDSPTPSYNLHVVAGDLDIHQTEVCFDLGEVTDALAPCDEADVRLPRLLYHAAGVAPSATLQSTMDEIAHATAFFSTVFGPYPYAKLGFVSEPHPFAMEYPSLVALPSAGAGVHELAHHWWGDPLWIEDWGDFWISEGFTTYFTRFYEEYRDGGAPPSFSPPDGRLAWPPGTDPNSIFDNVPYDRGAAAVADLRRGMAEAAGLDPASAAARDLFIAAMRALYRSFRFEHLGADSLLDFLRAELAPVSMLAGDPISQAAVEALVDDWEWRWLTWQEAEAHLDLEDGRQSHEMIPAIIGPPLDELGSVTGPLAWYGMACNAEDGSSPEPAQPVAGRIALIERGVCPFVEKMANAQAMGAEAVLMYTTETGEKTAIQGSIEGLEIPGGMIDHAPGLAARERLEAGSAITATLEVRVYDRDDKRLAPRGR